MNHVLREAAYMLFYERVSGQSQHATERPSAGPQRKLERLPFASQHKESGCVVRYTHPHIPSLHHSQRPVLLSATKPLVFSGHSRRSSSLSRLSTTVATRVWWRRVDVPATKRSFGQPLQLDQAFSVQQGVSYLSMVQTTLEHQPHIYRKARHAAQTNAARCEDCSHPKACLVSFAMC